MAADPARVTARILIETESVLFRPENPFVLGYLPTKAFREFIL